MVICDLLREAKIKIYLILQPMARCQVLHTVILQKFLDAKHVSRFLFKNDSFFSKGIYHFGSSSQFCPKITISDVYFEKKLPLTKDDTCCQTLYAPRIKRTQIRAVGRSENPWVPVLLCRHNLYPLVEIGLISWTNWQRVNRGKLSSLFNIFAFIEDKLQKLNLLYHYHCIRRYVLCNDNRTLSLISLSYSRLHILVRMKSFPRF